ncbi:PEP-CTERM sorting domain-containing protein [Aerosakkonemataceae cyanobacterium BLCC-F50]|uniref:PEP-CTERM sorting domain-containing protein n=1 Tax=Floridaenema flaviceps BLCC-F50 TaxID=3153642 RepID=A0ABV4XZA8_9CYAN
MPIKSTLTYLSLVTGSILTLAASPTQAAVIEFSTAGIKFDRDTNANFQFVSAQGSYLSNLGVYNVASQNFTSLFQETQPFDSEANDFTSTCGTGSSAIPNCNATFTFLKDTEYSLALLSEGEPTVYSTTALNDTSLGFGTQAQFSGNNPNLNPVLVAFEDRSETQFIDFNDFKVRISTDEATTSVPEPATIAGLILVGGIMLTTRLRQINRPS